MSQSTDPLRELVDTVQMFLGAGSGQPALSEIAERLNIGSQAEAFEFFWVIQRRIDDVYTIISEIDIDDDLKDVATESLNKIKSVFSIQKVDNSLNFYEALSCIDQESTAPLRLLSNIVRLKVSYPKLDDVEVEEISKEIAQMISWLNDHQLREEDFIREALIEGLERTSFRLAHFRAFGRRYTIESLREVIAAYMALEKAGLDPAQEPNAEAILRKTGALCGKIFDKLSLAKDATETAVWSLAAYGAVNAALAATHLRIAGLLQ